MISVRRAAALALPLALSTTVLVGPAGAADPPASVEAPAPGTCWNPTYEQAAKGTYTGAPVACTESHTVETVITLEVPKGIAAKGNESRELVAWLDPQCQTEVNRYAGVADPETTAPGTRTWYFWFTPTQKDWKAGNHWVSCAAGSVPVSMNKGPRTVPVINSVANSPGRNKERTYKTDNYGVGRFVARKPLTDLAAGTYPGTTGLQKIAWKFCKKTVGSDKYFWYGPSEKEWYEGWTAIQCYATGKK